MISKVFCYQCAILCFLLLQIANESFAGWKTEHSSLIVMVHGVCLAMGDTRYLMHTIAAVSSSDFYLFVCISLISLRHSSWILIIILQCASSLHGQLLLSLLRWIRYASNILCGLCQPRSRVSLQLGWCSVIWSPSCHLRFIVITEKQIYHTYC